MSQGRQPSSAPAPDEPQPRTVERPCPRCGHLAATLNGAHYGDMRRKAKVTLTEMARVINANGEKVGVSYLSQMERGNKPFREKYAAVYVRLLDRRRKSGQDW